MSVTRDADSRRTETPNAVMTTLASSTQGGSEIAVWRVEMAPEASGPPHIFDTEQVWTVLGGGARILLAGEEIAVATGDTVIMPADTLRQVFADTEHGFTAIVCAAATARVYPKAEVPPPATSDDEMIVPAWII